MKNCWVAVITHSFGTDATVCATQELAMNEVHKFIVQWWYQVSTKQLPEDRDTAIEYYFDMTNGSEWFDVIESPMIGFEP